MRLVTDVSSGVNGTFLGKAMVVLGRVQARMWARGADLGFVVCAGTRVVSGRV